MKRVVSILLIVLLIATFFVSYQLLSFYFKEGFEKDLVIIDKIDMFGLVGYCEQASDPTNCYKFAARLKGDATVCEDLEGFDLNQCLGVVGIETSDKNVCLLMNDQNMKSICQREILKKTSNELICEQVAVDNVTFTRDQCYLKAAEYTSNEKLCDKTSFSEECYLTVGLQKQDLSICEKSADLDYVDYCRYKLGENCEDLTNNDLKYYCKAKESSDVSQCAYIVDYEKEKDCVVELGNLDASVCKTYSSDYQNCLKDMALLSGDETTCDSFDVECKILVAVKYGKAEICEELDSKDCYHNLALSTEDELYCDKISVGETNVQLEVQEEQCISQVAVLKQDLDICSNLRNSVVRDLCQRKVNTRIAEETGDETYCEDNEESLSDNLECYYNVAVSTGNYKLCEYLEEASYEELSNRCYELVMIKKQEEYFEVKEVDVNRDYLEYCSFSYGDLEDDYEEQQFSELKCKIKLTRDYSLCQGIISKDYTADCYNYILSLTDNSNICGELVDPYNINTCYKNFARKLKDPTLCSKLTNEYDGDVCVVDLSNANPGMISVKEEAVLCSQMNAGKDNCYSKLAIKTKDKTLCNQISSTDGKTNCLIDVAEELADESICAEIKEKYDSNDPSLFVDNCYSAIAAVTDDKIHCVEIIDEYSRYSCFADKSELYYLSWANENCKIQTGINKDYCNLRLAYIDKKETNCEKIKQSEIKDLCYRELSRGKEISYCELISNSDVKDYCYAEMGELLKDVELCLKVNDVYEHDHCLNNVASLIGSNEPCNSLNSRSSFSQSCGQYYI